MSHLRPQEEGENEDGVSESVAQIGVKEESLVCKLGAYGISFHELVCKEPQLAAYEEEARKNGSSRANVNIDVKSNERHHRRTQSASVFDAPPMAPSTPMRSKDEYDAFISKTVDKERLTNTRATRNRATSSKMKLRRRKMKRDQQSTGTMLTKQTCMGDLMALKKSVCPITIR